MRSEVIAILVSALSIIPPACSKERSCENCVFGEGTVTFYTLNGCVNSKPIKLKINNGDYIVEQANFSVPECNSSGTVTISLPAGDYSYQKTCDFPGSTTTGTITVIENTCIKVVL